VKSLCRNSDRFLKHPYFIQNTTLVPISSDHSFLQNNTYCKSKSISSFQVDSGFSGDQQRLHHSSSVKKRGSYATLDTGTNHQVIMGTNVMYGGAGSSMNTIEERVKRVGSGRPMSAPRTGEFKRCIRNKSSQKMMRMAQ
jgi:hypothetical protein